MARKFLHLSRAIRITIKGSQFNMLHYIVILQARQYIAIFLNPHHRMHKIWVKNILLFCNQNSGV